MDIIEQIRNKLTCQVCGQPHNKANTSLVGSSPPREMIYSGHEYSIITENGGGHAEIWRLGFLREEGEGEDSKLVFTAAREHQHDDTVTVIIMAEDIRTVREVSIDKSKRHVSRSTMRKID